MPASLPPCSDAPPSPRPHLAIATLWADLLGEAGIAVTVQRAYACGLVGQIPPDQALPEIWVRHDEQHGNALALLDALERSPEHRWLCRGCGEKVEGLFEQCWNCGAPMPRPA